MTLTLRGLPSLVRLFVHDSRRILRESLARFRRLEESAWFLLTTHLLSRASIYTWVDIRRTTRVFFSHQRTVSSSRSSSRPALRIDAWKTDRQQREMPSCYGTWRPSFLRFIFVSFLARRFSIRAETAIVYRKRDRHDPAPSHVILTAHDHDGPRSRRLLRDDGARRRTTRPRAIVPARPSRRAT